MRWDSEGSLRIDEKEGQELANGNAKKTRKSFQLHVHFLVKRFFVQVFDRMLVENVRKLEMRCSWCTSLLV